MYIWIFESILLYIKRVMSNTLLTGLEIIFSILRYFNSKKYFAFIRKVTSYAWILKVIFIIANLYSIIEMNEIRKFHEKNSIFLLNITYYLFILLRNLSPFLIIIIPFLRPFKLFISPCIPKLNKKLYVTYII